MRALCGPLIAASVLLGGCFYPTTFYRASAEEGGYRRTGCPGREETWVFTLPQMRMATEVSPRENFELFMLLTFDATAAADLAGIQLKADGRTYQPLALEKRFYPPCNWLSCPPQIERNPDLRTLTSGQYVALFPKEIEGIDRLSVMFPPFVVQGMSVNLASVTFTKTKEMRYFTINC